MLVIRPATEADIDAIVTMGESFIAGTEYRDFIGANRSSMQATAARMLENRDAIIFLSQNVTGLTGMIGGVVYVHPYSGALTAFEAFWWTEPTARARGTGVRLLRAFERWAQTKGATHVQMVAPNGHVGSFYERAGYALVECSYQRAL